MCGATKHWVSGNDNNNNNNHHYCLLPWLFVNVSTLMKPKRIIGAHRLNCMQRRLRYFCLFIFCWVAFFRCVMVTIAVFGDKTYCNQLWWRRVAPELQWQNKGKLSTLCFETRKHSLLYVSNLYLYQNATTKHDTVCVFLFHKLDTLLHSWWWWWTRRRVYR